MDIIIYFIENGIDLTSLVILFGVFIVFEIVGEIIAEIVARQLINTVKGWLGRK